MKATSDIKQGFVYRIDSIILTFEDGKEIELNQIYENDFDLDSIESSWIYIENALLDISILNRFKCAEKDKMVIKHVHIESNACDIKEDCKENKIFIDIPCSMRIRELRLDGVVNEVNTMKIRLEGWVN